MANAVTFKITKDTITLGLKETEKEVQSKAELAVARGLMVMRNHIVPLTPRKTGRLVGSISGKPFEPEDSIYEIKSGSTVIIGKIGTAVDYAEYVEFGTSRMAPRLMFSVGLQESLRDVQTVIYNTMKFGN